MHRLSYKIYPPQSSIVAAAKVVGSSQSVASPPPPRLHVVVMHGLLGCYRNWQSVCTTLTSTTLHRAGSDVDGGGVQCVAFDWRNHGDSMHMEHSLDGLADDVQDFVSDYAQAQQRAAIAVSSPSNDSCSPIDVVIMGHSMGGMGMMHFLWDRHTRHMNASIAARTAAEQAVTGHPSLLDSRQSGASPPSVNPSFHNQHYRIVGAIAVDIAPAPRPESFKAMITAVEFLRELPTDRMTSYGDMEAWLLENGPKPYYTKSNIWMIRYFVSNVDVAKRQWKAGIEEIVAGTSKILWPHDNTVAGSGGAVSPLLHDFPVQFVFGGASPYYNPRATDAIPNYFKDYEVNIVPGASHFLFMEQRKGFCDHVKEFLERRVLVHADNKLEPKSDSKL